MNVKTVVGGCIGFAMLAACAGGGQVLSPYRAPASGETAKLLVKTSVSPATRFQLISFSDAQYCTGAQLVATQADTIAEVTFALLKAGQLSTLSFRTTAGMNCEVIGSFYPRAGHTYLLAARDTGGHCGMHLEDISKSAAAVSEPSFVPRTLQHGACAPLTKVANAQTSRPQPAGGTLDDFKDILPGK